MIHNKKEKKLVKPSYLVAIQILNYEFLGPIKLSEWGPPMDEVVFLMMRRTKDTFEVIYAGESGKTDASDYFTKSDNFKCWIQNAGSEYNLYLSIYPMWGSSSDERKRIVDQIVIKYSPTCNEKQKTG